MALSTRIRRPVQQPFPFEDRSTYIDVATAGTTRQFCHAIAAGTPGAQNKWLTLVLGSGCASSRTGGNALVRALQRVCTERRQEAQKKGQEEGQVDGASFSHIVTTFGEALVTDRLRRELEDPDEDTDAQCDHVKGLFDLFLSAALLSALYFRIKSMGYEAPRRLGHRDVAVVNNDAAVWTYLFGEYVAPCRGALQRVQHNLTQVVDCLSVSQDDGAGHDAEQPNGRLPDSVRDLVQGIVKDLDGTDVLEVRLASVQSMAELAWLCLVTPQRIDVYPGWGDLLLDLSYDAPEEGCVGTPLFASMLLPCTFIRARYLSITENSWRLRDKGDPGGRVQLYTQAARVLTLQHDERMRGTRHGKRHGTPPVATAFVTSFDLELELSLLHQGKAFSIVLPVHSYDSQEENPLAKTCWIALKVPSRNDDAPRDRLKDLLNPDAGQWVEIDKKLEDYGPIVVRLAGCPLIQLPRLHRAADEDGRVSGGLLEFLKPPGPPEWSEEPKQDWDLAWVHAVVINEYDAGVQGMIDLITIPEENGQNYGLCPNYASGSDKWARFWMMLGVQVQDPALRQRISLVVSSLPRKHLQPGVGGNRGLAINQFATELERDLLRWHGFNVVRADVSAFSNDLEHYATHIEKGWPIQFAPGECDD